MSKGARTREEQHDTHYCETVVHVQGIKRTLRSIPGAYSILMPLVRSYRAWMAGRNERNIERFRRYCLFLSEAVPSPVFVKVGAHDGVTGDPCSDILVENVKWKGVLVEPVPYLFERLKKNFPDYTRFTLANVAVGESPGEATFYFVDPSAAERIPGLPPWFDMIGSFDRAHILKHLQGALEPFIIESIVNVQPLSALLDNLDVGVVHLLHIDTEGHDFDVLSTLDFTRHSPFAVFIEHAHLSSATKSNLRRLLRDNGYSIRDCGTDYFAVSKAGDAMLRQGLHQRSQR